jgi:hypothetical protein
MADSAVRLTFSGVFAADSIRELLARACGTQETAACRFPNLERVADPMPDLKPCAIGSAVLIAVAISGSHVSSASSRAF